MKVSIKTSAGEYNSTISDLKATAIVASNTLKSSNLNVYSLFFKGIKLDLLKTVSNYGIAENDTIVIGSKHPEDNILKMDSRQSVLAECDVEVAEKPKIFVQTNSDEAATPNSSSATSSSPNSAISSATSSPISKKKKNSKSGKKCNFANCNNAYLRIIGNCSDCGGNFCTKHRLMESHLCSGLTNIKKLAFARNANKLHSEQTVSQKV